MKPMYWHVPHTSGQVLIDIELETHTGSGCSLTACGIEPGKTREEIEKDRLDFLHQWMLLDEHETGEGEKYPEVKEKVKLEIGLLESEFNIVDEQGILFDNLKEHS